MKATQRTCASPLQNGMASVVMREEAVTRKDSCVRVSKFQIHFHQYKNNTAMPTIPPKK